MSTATKPNKPKPKRRKVSAAARQRAEIAALAAEIKLMHLKVDALVSALEEPPPPPERDVVEYDKEDVPPNGVMRTRRTNLFD